MNWEKFSKKELIQVIMELTRVAEENKVLAESATRQAMEWQTLYNQSLILSTDSDTQESIH